jgi:hypothetical protein
LALAEGEDEGGAAEHNVRYPTAHLFTLPRGTVLLPQCHWVIPFSDFIPRIVVHTGLSTKPSAIITYHDSSVCIVSSWIITSLTLIPS